MKIVVTHTSPDWDAIGSVWLIKRFLPGWDNAGVSFVPAGLRYKDLKLKDQNTNDPIEIISQDEVIHVDTGLGPLDHHQTSDKNVCGMSLTWEYVQSEMAKAGIHMSDVHIEAITRIVRLVVDIDHFGEVFWSNPAADHHEFSLLGVLEGLKQEKQEQDDFYLKFGIDCLNALMHTFENRIWAEREIENAKKFVTRYGTGLGFETLNDTVLKLAQKMGYVLVVRKDPRKGYVRIKAKPDSERDKNEIDLTLAYEMLKKIDPDATWFLHVSKKMLLNGTPKNPKMVPTKLKLDDIIKVLEKI